MNFTSQKISEKSTQTKILITYHIDDLMALINNCKINPKVIGLLEARHRKNGQSLSNANLENYMSPHQQSLVKVEPCCMLTNS